MRKIIKIIFVSAILILLLKTANYSSTHYVRCGTVTATADDIVEVTDTIGYTWEFYGTDFQVGQKVKMMMNDNGTENTFYDDIIEKVERGNE